MPDGGGGNSKKQTGSQVTSNEPWKPLQPGLQTAINATNSLWNKGGFQDANTPYEGPTVAGVSPLTQQSWQNIGNMAANGNTAVNAGQKYVTGLLSGDTSQIQPLIDNTRNAVNATYAGAGRYGSGAHDSAVANAVGTVIANQMGGAAQLAPTYQAAGLQLQNAANAAGQQQQGQQQALLDAAQNLYYQKKQAPYNAIAQYMNLLTGMNTGGTSSTAMYGGNTGNTTGDYITGGLGIGASLLGGALAGGYL